MFCFSRKLGAVKGSLGSTASLVLVQRDRPASVTDCVWMGSTAPESVSVTKALRGRPVKAARAESTEFTVIKVGEGVETDCRGTVCMA